MRFRKSIDREDNPRVGGFNLNWRFSGLIMLRCASVAWIAEGDLGDVAIGEEKDAVLLLGERGS